MKESCPKDVKRWQERFFSYLETQAEDPTSLGVNGKDESERRFRANIYSLSYSHRLQQAITEDLPRSRRTWGAKRWNTALTRFISKEGSQRASLNELSNDFFLYLQRHRKAPRAILREIEIELAKLKIRRRAKVDSPAPKITATSSIRLSDRTEWATLSKTLVSIDGDKVRRLRPNRVQQKAIRALLKGTTVDRLSKLLERERMGTRQAQRLFRTWAKRGLLHWG